MGFFIGTFSLFDLLPFKTRGLRDEFEDLKVDRKDIRINRT